MMTQKGNGSVKAWHVGFVVICNLILFMASAAAWLAMGAWLPWLSFDKWCTRQGRFFSLERIALRGKWTPLVKMRRRYDGASWRARVTRY